MKATHCHSGPMATLSVWETSGASLRQHGRLVAGEASCSDELVLVATSAGKTPHWAAHRPASCWLRNHLGGGAHASEACAP
eukprot:2858522-Amphidinium_carterae.1